MEAEIQFVKSILPEHYTVKESNRKGSIHCKSPIGIRHKIDADDDEHWEYIVKAIKEKFGNRFQEISHNTCFCHVDFTIYLKKITSYTMKDFEKGLMLAGYISPKSVSEIHERNELEKYEIEFNSKKIKYKPTSILAYDGQKKEIKIKIK